MAEALIYLLHYQSYISSETEFAGALVRVCVNFIRLSPGCVQTCVLKPG